MCTYVSEQSRHYPAFPANFVHELKRRNSLTAMCCWQNTNKNASFDNFVTSRQQQFLFNEHNRGIPNFLTISNCPPFISSPMINFEPYLQNNGRLQSFPNQSIVGRQVGRSYITSTIDQHLSKIKLLPCTSILFYPIVL